MRRRAVVALALVLAACGSALGPTPPEKVGAKLGCTMTEEDTEELFVLRLYDCAKGGKSTRVYFFKGSGPRDKWLAFAEDFGAVVLDKGSDWVQVK